MKVTLRFNDNRKAKELTNVKTIEGAMFCDKGFLRVVSQGKTQFTTYHSLDGIKTFETEIESDEVLCTEFLTKNQ